MVGGVVPGQGLEHRRREQGRVPGHVQVLGRRPGGRIRERHKPRQQGRRKQSKNNKDNNEIKWI